MQQPRFRRIQVVVEQRRLSVSLSDELRLPERALHGETRGQRARATRPEDGQAAFERDEQRLWTQGHSKQVWSTPRGARILIHRTGTGTGTGTRGYSATHEYL